MRFNLMFPMRAVKHFDRWIGDGDLAEVAVAVEEAGFDAIAMSEHPFPDREWLGNGGHHAFDPFAALGYLAGRTQRINLITYVLVAGYRHPYLSAKAVATLDTLSGGRVVVGMAAGYLKSEFEVLGADFDGRGATLEAAIPAMRAAWNGEDHDSERFPAHGHVMAPAPRTQGGPPIWIGGNSRAARRRAVELADGWMPIAQGAEMAAITRTPPLETIDDLGRQIGEMQQRRTELGKKPLDLAFAPFETALLRDGDVEEFGQAVAERLPDYEKAGVTWLTVEPASRSLDAFRRDVARLGELLVPGA